MQRKRGGNNWIGIVIFLVIVIGPTLASFLSGAIRQATGVLIGSDMIIGGIVILAVVVSLVGSAARGLGRINSGSETRLPTTPAPPPQMGASPRPSSAPPTIGSSGAPPTQIPGGPRFEPVINPRILTFGIVGLIFFGVVFFAILAMSGAI